jgi:N-acyl-L-homoserine lactone synthetase
VDGIVALDALAERLLAVAAPVRVEVARAAADIEAIHRLRYEHVVDEHWARAEDLPGGLERDAYDDVAVQIAAWDGAALAGTLRLVPPVPGRRLPTEDAYGLVVEPDGRVAEVGRLLIAPAYRGDPAHRAWGALFGRCWLEARSRGVSVVAGMASAAMVERFQALGLPFEVLGPARPYWGALRHPVRLDPARGSAPGWYAV